MKNPAPKRPKMFSHGDRFKSPGGSFEYTVIGPCCRLYDRSELPWPSCSLSFRGKQPSWKREGKQHIPDISYCKKPSYAVQTDIEPIKPSEVWSYKTMVPDSFSIRTLPSQLTPEEVNWWYTKLPVHLMAEFLDQEYTYWSRWWKLQEAIEDLQRGSTHAAA